MKQMKKYLLLIISMVCAVTGAWAEPVPFGTNSTYEINGSTITINVGTRGDLGNWNSIPNLTEINKAVITGILGSKQNAAEDNNSGTNGWGSDGMALKNFSSCVVDLSGATMPVAIYGDKSYICVGADTQFPKNIIVPSTYASDPSSFPACPSP